MPKRGHTLGSDPEFFLRDRKTKKMISGIPHITGTKEEPELMKSGAGLQRDNVAVEFASGVFTDEEQFVFHIEQVFREIAKKVPKDLEIVAEPSAHFDKDQLNSPEALEFGCDPDYDAWKVEINQPPFCEDASLRSCGAHIHVGYVEDSGNEFLLNPYGKIDTVRAMDLLHGVISVILDNSEEAVKRRKLYGKAGSHRPTDYGVEYRVLSNFWFKSPQLVMLMTGPLLDDVLRIVRDGTAGKVIDRVGKQRIIDTINEGKIEEATDILNNFIRPILSNESAELLDLCLENYKSYDFRKAWFKKEKA
jgi:hypothetical protein